MEKMPKLKWIKILDFDVSYDNFYILKTNGIDKSGRVYFYSARIYKTNVLMKDFSIKIGYKAEYHSFLETTYSSLRDKDAYESINFDDTKESFRTLAEAKNWVMEAFNKQWEMTHK